MLIEITFQVNEVNIFTPDVAVLRRDRLLEAARVLSGAPESAVEVVSPTDTAEGLRQKINTDLRSGSQSVWVFYSDGAVAIHRTSGVSEIQGDQRLEDALLPGFSVPVSRLFAL